MRSSLYKRHRFWNLSTSKDGIIDCRIYNTPINSKHQNRSILPVGEYEPNAKRPGGQYLIHISGLHHTGTGYLRQSLHDALTDEYSSLLRSNAIFPVASMQNSLRPYQHLLDQAKASRNQTRVFELMRQYRVPEDEGHHLQRVYPQFSDRVNISKGGGGVRVASKIPYLADFCYGDNGTDGHSVTDRQIGEMLLKEWLPYWDDSATFLIQKSPTLDISFLERVKVLPTFHVIVIRHPMIRNSFG